MKTPGERSARVEEARRLGFYPLLLLLEALTGGRAPGESASPAEERIRLRHDPSLAFSTGDVASVRELPIDAVGREADAGRAFEVTTTFLGLTGGISPLPPYMAEEVAQEQGEVPRMRDFLDLFHHRMLSLLYRGWASHDLPNAWRVDGQDPWTRRLLALLGFDDTEAAPQGRDACWLLRLAPLLAERNVTAAGLAMAIEDALAEPLGGARARVEPLVGSWVPVAQDQWTSLGRAGRLGRDCLMGRRVLDAAGRFRVRIGPLSREHYRRFVECASHGRVEELIAALVREPLEHETVLWLAEEAAPALRLGGARLSTDAWLGGQPRSALVTLRALR